MAFTVEERDTSRIITSGVNPSVELRYIVRGVGADADDEQQALAALENPTTGAPATFMGMPRKNVRLEPVHVDGSSESLWNGEVTYEPVSLQTDPPQDGESFFSFDTGGGSQHITQSLNTSGVFVAPGEAAPDFKGAIGVTDDSVEGVDIIVPVYQFTETHGIADSVVTQAYKILLMQKTGKVNSDAFRGFAAGEVLFMGAAGSKRGDGTWEISFRFGVSPNANGLTVGPITGIVKKGWEYLWVRYDDAEDGSAQSIVKRPVAAYVEQVYQTTSFSDLIPV